jgi:hypothetical protein
MGAVGRPLEVSLFHSGNKFTVTTCPGEVLKGEPSFPCVEIEDFEITTHGFTHECKATAWGEY